MVSSYGQTEGGTLEIGRMANNMEREKWWRKMEGSKRGSGRMEKKSRLLSLESNLLYSKTEK